ncbi:MAG: energy-coupling factor transporter transmembrane protein EcfT [Treponema sp.]|jgi:energy-coupling factor transport system permease protein|nr:energy-coupling factor transporter transmembrane protein EcfT [Treponema sp.]
MKGEVKIETPEGRGEVNMALMLSYIEKDSPIHRLSGLTKLVVFLLWSVLTMAGYDTRVMLGLCATGAVLFIISRTQLAEVSFIFKMLFFFMALNILAIYVFAPEQGVLIYGTRHIIVNGVGRWTLTAEQLFYEFNLILKYISVVPVAILLIVTTHPSEFAASLNRIGVSYSIAFAVSLTLRYIPDVQRDYKTISQSQQARGLELSAKAHPLKRLKGAANILLPLIFSSLDRIDVISRAMELRGFGKNKKRTWFAEKPFSSADKVILLMSVLLFGFALWFTFKNGSRFYNPFK